jgi:hypothetical protein
MKQTPANAEAYKANGYKDREDYLNGLADGKGIEPMAVSLIADMLGPSKDFDGLIAELEDFNWEN